jgi:hypothetical protein
MPSPHYRRRRLTQACNKSSITSTYIHNTTTNECSTSGGTPTITVFQNYIFEIIEVITTTLDITIITNKVYTFLELVKSKQDLYDILDLIEENLLGIIVNISNGVDINIIRSRIDYIKELLDSIGDEPCNNYQTISALIYNLLDSIPNGIDLNVFITNIQSFKSTFQDQIDFYTVISLIEETILNIVNNISNGVDVNIIRSRIEYIKELVNTLEC